MIKLFTIVLGLALALPLHSQEAVRWVATTGDVSLVAATTAATVQQPATNGQVASIDQVIVYCSVACNVTFAVNGTAASATAGTITPLLPNPLNTPIVLTFWTASNAGAGTAQGFLTHIPAGATVTFCFSPSCGASSQYYLPATGTGSNFTISISSITGNANVGVIGRQFRQ